MNTTTKYMFSLTKEQYIDKIVETLKKAKQPRSEFVELMENFNDPYLVLIGCILSLRTNDKTTYPATLRMLELAKTPAQMSKVSPKDLAKAIYPVGFYENKAKQIIELSRQIVEELDGKVKVGKVNVDEQNELAVQYQVASIPTLLLFKNGKLEKTSVGFMPKQAILAELGL